MKTFRCFNQIDVTRFVILLCFAFMFLAGSANNANSAQFAYDHAIIQNTEVIKCWSLRYLSEETIDKLADNDVLRNVLLSEIAESVAKELGVTVRSIEIRNKNLLCISYGYGHKKPTPSNSSHPRFY